MRGDSSEVRRWFSGSILACHVGGLGSDSWPMQCPYFGLSRWHSDKETSANADTREAGLIPGWGRSPEEGNGNLLQFFCLENPRVQSMESW